MGISRRQFLQGSGVALASLQLPTGWASTPVGSAHIMTFSDGHLAVPAPSPLNGVGDTAMTERPCNITVLQTDSRTVVFDVGAGPNFMPSAGKLAENLENAGIALEDVTDVLFTHAHPDHFWGVLDDFDEPLFPEARYAMHRGERDWWLDPNTMASLPENRQVFASAAKRLIAALGDQLEVFTPGDEVAPGIEALATPGHTPGHCSFVLHNGSESAVVLGDVVVDETVSFTNPALELSGDIDPQRAVRTRTTLLDRLASEGTLLSGFHLNNGGLGYAVRDGADQYRLEPA